MSPVSAAAQIFSDVRRRDWWALGIPSRYRFVILVLFTVEGINRGVRYLLIDPSTRSALSALEQAMPLPVWGAVFLLGSTAVIAGILTRWLWPIANGALVLGAAYATLAVGLAFDGNLTSISNYILLFVISGVWFTVFLGYRSTLYRSEVLHDMRDGVS